MISAHCLPPKIPEVQRCLSAILGGTRGLGQVARLPYLSGRTKTLCLFSRADCVMEPQVFSDLFGVFSLAGNPWGTKLSASSHFPTWSPGTTLKPWQDAKPATATPHVPPSRPSSPNQKLRERPGLTRLPASMQPHSPQCPGEKGQVAPAEAPIILSSPRTSKTDSYELVWRPRHEGGNRAPILYYLVKHRKVWLVSQGMRHGHLLLSPRSFRICPHCSPLLVLPSVSSETCPYHLPAGWLQERQVDTKSPRQKSSGLRSVYPSPKTPFSI